MLSLSQLLTAARKCPVYDSWDFGDVFQVDSAAWDGLPTLNSSFLKSSTPFLAHSPVHGGETVYYSSGTTDTPKLIFFSDEDLQRIYLLCSRFSSVERIGPQNRVMVLLPMSLWSVGKITVQGLLLQGAKVFPVDLQGDVALWNRMAEKIRPNVISSTPSVLAAWASRYTGPRLNLVETTGEPLLYSERNLIEEAFGAPVYDAYGLTECVVGVECESHTGFHYWPDAVHVDILDPERDVPVPPGESGEIVLTSFMQERLPIIRYRSGDRGRLLLFPCECGRALPRVFFEGRLTSSLSLPRGVQLDEQELRDVLLRTGLAGVEIRWKARPGSPAEMVMAEDFRPTLDIVCRGHSPQGTGELEELLCDAFPELAELIYEKDVRVNVLLVREMETGSRRGGMGQ